MEVVPEFHIRATSFDDESVATFREAKWLSLRHAKVSGETIMAEAIKEFGGDASP